MTAPDATPPATGPHRAGGVARTGRPVTPAAERFWPKVQQVGDCWEFRGSTSNGGYGQFRDGRLVLAHRWAYQFMVGEIPDGLTLDHLCRNTVCVNPAHLDPVPNGLNISRSHAVRSHCCGGTCATYPAQQRAA